MYNLNDTKNILTKLGEEQLVKNLKFCIFSFVEQAIETGKFLNNFYKFDLIISLPKIRALKTAELIAEQMNYKKKL
jgi:hypothetical protein